MRFKTGPYMHDLPAMDKTFVTTDGGKRSFKLLVSTAYNAGIIGSEYNGVVVLDEDNRQVVTDRSLSGNVTQQVAFVNELMQADWQTFSQLVRETPRFRGLPEFKEPSPQYTYPLPEQDNWPVMDACREGEVEFGAVKRLDVVRELLAHPVHHENHRPWRFAWNVKLNSHIDDSGTSDTSKPYWNARWAKQLKIDDGLFYRAIETARSGYCGDEYSTFPGDDEGDYTLGFEGRSGGWLVIEKIKGLGAIAFENMNAMEEWLMDLDSASLKKVYRLVRHLDHDLSRAKIAATMKEVYNDERYSCENKWAEDLQEVGSVAAALLNHAVPVEDLFESPSQVLIPGWCLTDLENLAQKHEAESPNNEDPFDILAALSRELRDQAKNADIEGESLILPVSLTQKLDSVCETFRLKAAKASSPTLTA